MSCNEINLQEAFFLFSCQKKKKKGILHRHHKKLIFQIIPCSFQGCKLHLRWFSLRLTVCGLRLFLALLQDAGPCDLSAALTVTYDLTLTHPASHLPLVAGLKAWRGKTLLLLFLLLFLSTDHENWAVHHIQGSHRYAVNLTRGWSSQLGKQTCSPWPRTFGRGNRGRRIPDAAVLYPTISNHFSCQV